MNKLQQAVKKLLVEMVGANPDAPRDISLTRKEMITTLMHVEAAVVRIDYFSEKGDEKALYGEAVAWLMVMVETRSHMDEYAEGLEAMNDEELAKEYVTTFIANLLPSQKEIPWHLLKLSPEPT